MTGTIKKIMRQKGFGFIKPDDGSEDVFFHRGSLAPRSQLEDINEGDTVQFQTRKGEKGPVAFDLISLPIQINTEINPALIIFGTNFC